MEQVRSDPTPGDLFDAAYFATGLGLPYERNDHWLNFFGLMADEIVRSLKPRTVLDAGCALGFLVESLWDRGVEAHGVDVSAFAISQVRRDMQRYCRQASLTEPLQGRYDLVTCIEVLEHMPPEESEAAIANLTAVTDTILFSSTPSNFEEPTHFNVQPPIRWLNQFAAFGFWPNCTFDAGFVAPHAMLLHRQPPPPQDVLMLFSEKLRLKSALVEREQRIGSLNARIHELEIDPVKPATRQIIVPAQLIQPDAPVAAPAAGDRGDAQAELVEVRRELVSIYSSPGWQLISSYRSWLERGRRTTHWITSYEKAANWILRRGGLASKTPPAEIAPSGAPREDDPLLDSYQEWIAANEPDAGQLELQRSISRQLRLQPLISLVVPVYKVPLRVLRAMVDSVLSQTYPNWELCIAHGDPEDESARKYLLSAADQNSRVKVRLLEANAGISGNSNAALALASGEFIGLLDHDDTLAPFALFEIANAINESPDADLLYSDKDCITDDDRRLRPLFKPSWSPDVMLSANYLTHFTVIRADNLRNADGWRLETEGAQDWDIFLRAIGPTSRVVFVPGILYHWRILSTSVAGGGLQAKPYAAAAQVRTINDHLARRALHAQATTYGEDLRIKWNPETDPSIAVIVLSSSADPSSAGRAAERLDRLTNWPNLEILAPGVKKTGRLRPLPDAKSLPDLLNASVKSSSAEIIVFIDDSVEITEPDWLHEMAGPFQQPEIGVVGAKLLDATSGKIRHAGLVFNSDGAVDYVFAGQPEHVYNQFGAALWYRNWSAVSGACFAVRRSAWESAGGFRHEPAYPRHDIDLCLRIGVELGHRIFYTPFFSARQGTTSLLETWLASDAAETGPAYIRLCFPQGDPHFHRQLESRGGRVLFARPRKKITVLDYAGESRALVKYFEASPSAIESSRSAAAGARLHSVRNATLILPDFSHAFYGGIHTALRFADYFHRVHGVRFEIAELGGVPSAALQARIAGAFPDLAQDIRVSRMNNPGNWDDISSSDIVISTLWATAYAALNFNRTRKKFYLIQDYEPLFYPAGSTSALVEETYRFGFYGICNTRPLADAYAEFGGEATYFTPSIDPRYFYPAPERDHRNPYVVFCYARPGHPRNCFELLTSAMRILKQRLGDRVRIVSAGAEWRPEDYGLGGVLENLGLLGYSATGALYRVCDAGVVMMKTRHPSYLPFELMACGALVVTNPNRHTSWLLKDAENCLLADAGVTAIAQTIERGLRDERLRRKITDQAADMIRREYSDWDAQAERVYEYVLSKS